MTNFDNMNPLENIKEDENKSFSAMLKTVSFFKILQYLFLAALIFTGIITIILPKNTTEIICLAAFAAICIFLFFTNKQLLADSQATINQSDLNRKAELYTCLLENSNGLLNNSINRSREQALKYCQELITDYKKTRETSRNIYYISQLATVVLSGVTPILVLVDKLEADTWYLKWLPVIFPALAAIIASIVTSFPLESNWIAANSAVESLEAEQEKFVLGVSLLYRCYDIPDEVERQQKAKQAVDNFINEVNTIHLKRVQELEQDKPQAQNKDKG